MTKAASPIGPGPISSGPTNSSPISPGESSWALAWRIARREIRGSVARFRVFLGALMLGVAAIGTVGSVAEAMRDGIAGNARLLLGGDVELRSLYMPTPDPVLATAQEYGTLSRTITMWAMLASPLVAGNDVRTMSAATRSILTNTHVIGVNQDALGKQATLVAGMGPGGRQARRAIPHVAIAQPETKGEPGQYLLFTATGPASLLGIP